MSQNEVYGRYTKPVFGADVVYAADPKKRNQQMQHMAYGLRTARLKSYVPMIEKETRNFLKSWGASVSESLRRIITKKRRDSDYVCVRFFSSSRFCLVRHQRKNITFLLRQGDGGQRRIRYDVPWLVEFICSRRPGTVSLHTCT